MQTIEEVKRQHVLAVLAACEWNRVRAAEVLGVSLKSLYNWINRWEQQGQIKKDGLTWVLLQNEPQPPLEDSHGS